MNDPLIKSKKVGPHQGGCWFCCTKDETLVFDWEFDTWVHTDCIREHLDDEDSEAQFMKYLLE